MATLDDILNVGIPILLIVIALGFLWVKFIEPWVLPMIVRIWEKMTTRQEATNTRYSKEILYE